MSVKKTESSSTRNAIIVIITIVLYFVLSNLPTPQGLTIEGQKSIALMICALIVWITEVIPMGPASLLFAVLMVIIKTATPPQMAANFMPLTTFFCISCFIIGQALLDTGLGNRIVVLLLKASKNRPKRMLLLSMCVTSLISLVIANLALSAMMVPLMLKIFQENNMKPKESNFAKSMLIGIPIAISIGGAGTPAGALPNYQALALASEISGTPITFLDWVKWGIPFAVIMTPIAYFAIVAIFKPEVKELVSINMDAQVKELGKLKYKEISFMVIFALLILSWFVTDIPMPVSAIIACGIFFLPKIEILNAEGFKKAINWNIIMLICGSTALALTIFQTGAAKWLAESVLSPFKEMNPLILIAVAVLLTIYMHLLVPVNPSLVAILIPVIAIFAPTAGIPVAALVLPVAYAINAAFLLPLDPVFAVTYASGYYTMKDLPKAGVPLSIVWTIVMVIIMAIVL
ncbi:SLC13 family permease [Parasporobacterium paucivorans]|uniref:Solute carrier family 13 (Sodium-dependent dicarboxylate transporter), member 2/3/5 n=1 Tax=Parasporobacterium paucivorans DSM 15970 TaxID=1122934 RepID=A0A1M6IGX8_9FIRM|nr:DASS family sodium-coupled anion symporter [Parasporobacterium paucivorans]SHJ33715.1 solute carrier family 13 (sodium-dependent dicarboxylate transporter), member 2/3/5 [Parasporobacterium paucivorans DSM 15970]